MSKRLSAIVVCFSLGVIGAGVLAAQEAPTLIKVVPEATSDPKASSRKTATGKTTTFTYYKTTDNPRVSSGVWEADGFTGALHKVTNTEFIHVQRGVITLQDKSGRDMVFEAGDSLLIPRGTEVAWKSTENVKEFWTIFEVATPEGAAPPTTEPTVMRLDADGPAGTGLTGKGRTREYKYYSGSDNSSVGVWETEPFTAPEVHTPKYTEFMYLLSGTVTLTGADGKQVTFKAGEAAIAPRGVPYKWSSDRVRKFWVIFDKEK